MTKQVPLRGRRRGIRRLTWFSVLAFALAIPALPQAASASGDCRAVSRHHACEASNETAGNDGAARKQRKAAAGEGSASDASASAPASAPTVGNDAGQQDPVGPAGAVGDFSAEPNGSATEASHSRRIESDSQTATVGEGSDSGNLGAARSKDGVSGRPTSARGGKTGTKSGSASGTAGVLTGSITLTDQSFVCRGPVNLTSVTVNIINASLDAVHLDSGCTGYIGSINIVQYHGDGIKVGAGAHDLVIGGGTIRCYAHDPGKHQDGVQVMGGQNITFNNLDVGCYSANNSQAMIHTGAAGRQTPTNILFVGSTFNSQPGTYGPGGAYSVSVGDSIDSGYIDSTICPAHLHQWYVGAGALHPVNSSNSFPVSC